MEKQAHCEPLENARDLVKFLNENAIPKEDIVTVIDLRGQLLLVYYH